MGAPRKVPSRNMPGSSDNKPNKATRTRPQGVVTMSYGFNSCVIHVQSVVCEFWFSFASSSSSFLSRYPTLAFKTRGAAGEARVLPLDVPFDQVGSAGSCDEVSLRPLANRLALRELRRFLHRASYLLREGGEVRFLTRNPDDYPETSWPGETVEIANAQEHVRPLRHTLELLRLYPFRSRTPQALEASASEGLQSSVSLGKGWH